MNWFFVIVEDLDGDRFRLWFGVDDGDHVSDHQLETLLALSRLEQVSLVIYSHEPPGGCCT